MIYNADPLQPDSNPDDSAVRAMKAALRDLKVSLRQPPEMHPRRAEMLAMLTEARASMDRIGVETGGD